MITMEDTARVMEAACEICRWPFECEDQDQLCEKCAHCPVEIALAVRPE